MCGLSAILTWWVPPSNVPRPRPACPGKNSGYSGAKAPQRCQYSPGDTGEHCTRLTVVAGHDRLALRQFARRAFVHAKMKAVCEEFLKTAPRSELLQSFWPALHVTTNVEVQTIARNFVDLQEQRHASDYDLSARFSRQEALAAADLAEEAMEAWDSLRSSHEQLALLFALSLMLCPGLGTR
jgi:hypothetical protein